MTFIDVNKNEFEIIFTEEGLKTMLTKGLVSELIYFGLSDDNIIYTLNSGEQKTPDITGLKNNYSTIKFNIRNPLKNG
jgi:hypothetical protein